MAWDLHYFKGEVISEAKREGRMLFEYKAMRFFGMGAVIFLGTAFIGKVDDNRLIIAGLVFAALALLFANIGNIKQSREKNKTRLKKPKEKSAR